MGQPTFVRKIDGSNANASSLTLTMTTTAGDMLLVGVVLNANGAQSAQTVAAITDSAGLVSGVPVNNWTPLGNSTNLGIRMEWWACKGAVSITSLVINLTGLQSIIAVELEYSGANGITNPNFQALQPNQNTIASLHIRETASTFPNSGAELMIGLFAMLNDTFNAAASAPPLQSVTEVVRSTNSFSIPPALSYQVIEEGTVDTTGLLSVNALSATQLATTANLAACSMQCFYILISGGLILNTQPGFSDQPDSALAAGKFALGLQMAKINGNAALGMVRMELFQGVYTNGQTVNLPVSPVDGYQYQRNELIYIWAIYNTTNPNTGWLTGPDTLWFCGWKVDQTTGDVTCDEWYRTPAISADSADGFLQVFIVGQRQKAALTAAAIPTWTQQQASQFVTDLAYSTDLLVAMNENSKFAVVGQECISMGEFYNGQTVPQPVSPADGHVYSYAEVSFVYSWRWTCGQLAYAKPAWTPEEQLATLYVTISNVGVISCGVGWALTDHESYAFDTTTGRIAVFAFCQRARVGAPAVVANKFAEIPNALFYPGNPLPAGIGQQVFKNIEEAALSPEFFGPTLYAGGATIPTPVSAVDGYVYQRSELTYIWEWQKMDTGGSWPHGGSEHIRTAIIVGGINQTTGVVTTDNWRLAPGGPYIEYVNATAILSVLVIGFRTTQQTAVTAPILAAPSDAGTTSSDQMSNGIITVNGI